MRLYVPALYLALAASVACDPATRPVAEVPAEPGDLVHRELLDLCTDIRSTSNEYYGRAQIAELARYVEQPVAEPLPRAVARARLGMEMLRVGEIEPAIALLAEANEIATAAELDPELRLDILRRLGLAHLRRGERTNCVGMHGPASCIFPFASGAIHSDRRGSTEALRVYGEYLEQAPERFSVRWLSNVAAMTLGRYPDAVPAGFRMPDSALDPGYDIGRFAETAYAVGLRVVQPSGGAIMDDLDGDGRLDVLTSTIDPCGPMNFFHNDGDGRFEDRSEASGLSRQLGGLNTIHADYDNDGDPDLLVLRGGWLGSDGRMRNSLLRNDGSGVFVDITRAAGLAAPAYPTQTGGWADYDNDGDLDLYIGNEADHAGKPYPSQLFRNEGDGTFVDIAAEAGVLNMRMAKAVAWGDYDNDDDPDLYVSNVGPNRLFRNNGDGTFDDVAPELSVTQPEGRSFTTWFFDYDNDGREDIFVGDYSASMDDVAASLFRPDAVAAGRPRLYRNLGPDGFEEVGLEVGLTQACLPMGGNFGDLDNDGYLDFYLGVGTPSYESIAPNLMYRNDGGVRFQNVTYSGGFGHLQKGHGVAFGDLDQDGDQDVFEQMGGAYPGDAYPSVLYENPGHGNHWITLRLIGTRSNRSAIGARIRVELNTPRGPRSVFATVGSGGSFGGSSLQQEIGLGQADSIARVEVRWPTTGNVQRFDRVAMDRSYELVEGRRRLRP